MKNSDNTKCWQYGENDLLYIASGNEKCMDTKCRAGAFSVLIADFKRHLRPGLPCPLDPGNPSDFPCVCQ